MSDMEEIKDLAELGASMIQRGNTQKRDESGKFIFPTPAGPASSYVYDSLKSTWTKKDVETTSPKKSALDAFPSNPEDGQVVSNYRWSSAGSRWEYVSE